MMKTTLNAFLPEHNVYSYKYAQENGNYQQMINNLAFTSLDKLDGWIPMGIAEISVELMSDNDFVNAQVTALKEKKQSIQAETQLKINEIDHKIRELLCLPSPEETWL